MRQEARTPPQVMPISLYMAAAYSRAIQRGWVGSMPATGESLSAFINEALAGHRSVAAPTTGLGHSGN